MSSGERPIGAAKGKQPNTEALCQPIPPPLPCGWLDGWLAHRKCTKRQPWHMNSMALAHITVYCAVVVVGGAHITGFRSAPFVKRCQWGAMAGTITQEYLPQGHLQTFCAGLPHPPTFGLFGPMSGAVGGEGAMVAECTARGARAIGADRAQTVSVVHRLRTDNLSILLQPVGARARLRPDDLVVRGVRRPQQIVGSCEGLGLVGLASGGGGGSIEPPKSWGGGLGKGLN